MALLFAIGIFVKLAKPIEPAVRLKARCVLKDQVLSCQNIQNKSDSSKPAVYAVVESSSYIN
jgi:hypothetical protein